jgi:signal transduction histidine kinase
MNPNQAPGGAPINRRPTPLDDLHLYVAEIAALHRAVRFLELLKDPSDLLRALVDEALVSLGATRGLLLLLDYSRGELVVHSAAGENAWTEEARQLRLRVGNGHEGITGFVASTGRPYRTGNVRDDPHYYGSLEDTRSELAVPLKAPDGTVIGVLDVESREANAFDDAAEQLLMALAELGATAIAMADHHWRERGLIDVGKELSQPKPVEELTALVVDLAAQILRAEDSSLFLLDEEMQTLSLVASRGPLRERVGQARYKVGEGLTGEVARTGEVIRLADVRADPRWRGLYEEFPAEQVGAFLAVPVRGRQGTIGVLRVLRRVGPGNLVARFSEDDEELLVTLASQVGVAIQNARLVEKLVEAERMAAWGELSARSAHMIGNKLFGLKGHVNELQYLVGDSGGAQGAALRGVVRSICNSIFELEQILQEFKDFVTATRLNFSEASVNDVLLEVLEEVQAATPSLLVRLELDERLPTVTCDPSKIKRCFSELAENAVSFQPRDGELRIRTSRDTEGAAKTLCALPEGIEHVRIDFVDRGPGVPQDKKTEIFRPYFTTRSKGMGLGLSIVRGILRAHGGDICEIGTPGKGAWFVAFLPIKHAKEAPLNVEGSGR